MLKHLFSSFVLLTLLITACNNKKSPAEATEATGETDEIIVTDSISKSNIDVSKMQITNDRKTLFLKLLDNEKRAGEGTQESTGLDTITQNFIRLGNCYKTYPKRISELTDGISLEAYEFRKGDEVKLGLMGFLGIDIKTDEKITVVEFAQIGSKPCEDIINAFGIGARMMMRIRSTKRGAKLNTPQQITASVIFGKAEVSYSMKTFGITGPGTASFVKSGTVSENTYNEFINQIATLIVEMYKPQSTYIITPQLLPFK